MKAEPWRALYDNKMRHLKAWPETRNVVVALEIGTVEAQAGTLQPMVRLSMTDFIRTNDGKLCAAGSNDIEIQCSYFNINS
jgi:hypothetical protein